MRTAAAIATMSANAMAVGRGVPALPAAEVWVASMTSIGSPGTEEGPTADGVVRGVAVDGADPLAAAVAGAVALDVDRGFVSPFDRVSGDVELPGPPDEAVGRSVGGAAGACFTIAVHSAFGNPEIPQTSPPFARIEVTAVSTVSPVSPLAMRTQERCWAGGFSPEGASEAMP